MHKLELIFLKKMDFMGSRQTKITSDLFLKSLKKNL